MSSPLNIDGMGGVVFGTKAAPTSEVIPNFGYKRLCEEHDALKDQLAISTAAYRNLVPAIPTFAYLKDDPQVLQLFESYVKAQEKITRLLVSPSFLEDVLDLITGRKVRLIVTSSGKDLSKGHPVLNSPIESIRGKARDFGANGVENAVAHSIWNNLLEKDSAYIAAVVDGIRAAARARLKLEDGDPSSRPEQVQPILTYLRERGHRKTEINLQKSEEALSHYASIPDSREVIPQKLYYRLVQQGQGDELRAEHANVQIHHTISLLDLAAKDQAISIASFKMFGMKDLIPGLRYGMYGMRVGEVREIYIHPDYAYGLRSNFEPGLGLRIRVDLVSLGASLTETPPPGKFPFIDDCHALLPPMISEEEFRKLEQAAGFAEGFNAWSFFGNIEDLFTSEGVITSLQQQAKFSHPPEHQHAEKEFLQKLHILLYRSVISNREK